MLTFLYALLHHFYAIATFMLLIAFILFFHPFHNRSIIFLKAAVNKKE